MLIKAHVREIKLCKSFNTSSDTRVLKDLFLDSPHIPSLMPDFWCDFGFQIRFGENVWCNHNLTILDAETVTVGNQVLMGTNVSLISVDHPVDDVEARVQGLQIAKPIHIENKVWLGANVTVLGGVTVGEGAVVAAGSVVTKDVEPFTLVAGVPAVKKRQLG
jgi:maltose O-acetyltransferase